MEIDANHPATLERAKMCGGIKGVWEVALRASVGGAI